MYPRNCRHSRRYRRRAQFLAECFRNSQTAEAAWELGFPVEERPSGRGS